MDGKYLTKSDASVKSTLPSRFWSVAVVFAAFFGLLAVASNHVFLFSNLKFVAFSGLTMLSPVWASFSTVRFYRTLHYLLVLTGISNQTSIFWGLNCLSRRQPHQLWKNTKIPCLHPNSGGLVSG
ncbi:MAG: hypothetical protein KAJ46_00690 [Sedimentisphaerales bacterium]|nr:hypothetical protein [Sedimentisphaerales bacterium]